MPPGARTVFGQAAAAPEHGAVEEADEQRHDHAREVVGGAAPVAQPVLARQRHKLSAARRRERSLQAQLCAFLLTLPHQLLYQRLVVAVQLARLQYSSSKPVSAW